MTELTDATFYAPLTSSGTPTNGTGTFTFTRATAKKVINSAGVLESVTSGNLAINSDYGAHIDPASKTNNLLYCRDLTQTSKWLYGTGSANLIPDGGFDSGVSNWTAHTNCTLSHISSTLRMTTTANGAAVAYIAVSTVIGVKYRLDCTKLTTTSAANISVLVGTSPGNGSTITMTGSPSIKTGVILTATATTTYISLSFATQALAGEYSDFDNFTYSLAAVTVSLTGTGIDGTSNSCSVLTAAAADATCLQTITAAATAACSGFYVKRSVGTGSVYITRDGGSNWTDITSLINSSTFTCVKIENTSVTNPRVGFKIATSGDAIIVDAGLNHAGTQLCEPILTTTAAVTRNAEVLTYQTSGNFSDTAGTILATFRPTHDTWTAGSIVGKASFGLLTSTANSGVQAADGTNTINGASGSTLAGRKIGMKWSGSALKAFAGGTFGTAGSYDGAFNLTTVGINTGAAGYIRDVAIWTSSLSDADMLSVVCEKADFTSAIACTAVMLDAVIYASTMSASVNCDAAIFNNIINSVYMISAISIESIFDGISETGSESPANITIHASATYANVARIGVYANVATNGTYSSMQINADYP